MSTVCARCITSANVFAWCTTPAAFCVRSETSGQLRRIQDVLGRSEDTRNRVKARCADLGLLRNSLLRQHAGTLRRHGAPDSERGKNTRREKEAHPNEREGRG